MPYCSSVTKPGELGVSLLKPGYSFRHHLQLAHLLHGTRHGVGLVYGYWKSAEHRVEVTRVR